MLSKNFYWAVGLFEGEGSIHLSARKGGWIDRKLSLSITDEDVIRRFHGIVTAGTVTGPYTDRRMNRKPIWRWDCSRWDEIEPLLRRMLLLLCSRRKIKAHELLNKPPSTTRRKSKRFMEIG